MRGVEVSHLSDRAATGGTEPEGVAVVDELDAVAMEPTEWVGHNAASERSRAALRAQHGRCCMSR